MFASASAKTYEKTRSPVPGWENRREAWEEKKGGEWEDGRGRGENNIQHLWSIHGCDLFMNLSDYMKYTKNTISMQRPAKETIPQMTTKTPARMTTNHCSVDLKFQR